MTFDTLGIDRETTVDRVASELRRALFEGELEPGTPLREKALAGSLEVSRSTIREALGALVGDGLAVRIPNKGVAVRRVSAEAIRDVTRARIVLESAGIAHWRRAATADRDRVLEALACYLEVAGTDHTTAEFNEAHLRLHRSFVELAGSERLTAAADVLSAEIRLALATVDRTRRNVEAQAVSHQRLVDLLVADRIEEALAELEAHLIDGQDSMIEELGLHRASPTAGTGHHRGE